MMKPFVNEMKLLEEGKRKNFTFNMYAKHYWNITGRRKYPAIYQTIQLMLEMICSLATSERVWSNFLFIYSRLRNRLTNERVKKPVFIYTNSVLLDTNKHFCYLEASIAHEK